MDQPSSRHPSSKWPTAAADYILHKRIGNGAFSSVWKATCTPNTVDVAIKIMDLEHITTSFEDILQEVQTMRLCDNVHVLRCFSSFVQRDQLWLVTELMDRGSCLRVMNIARQNGFGEGMNEEWLAYILREALQGLHYLHENGQIHRDIKSGNILLDSGGNVRIADFGVSGWTLARGQRQETVKTFVGTPCWMAPEVMEQLEGYDHRADIWSIGITALELAKGMAPYAKYPPMRVLVLTIEEDPPSLKTYEHDRQRTGAPFSRMYVDFVKKCLQKTPKSRPSAEELLKHHKFLKGRSKDALLHQLLDHLPAVGGAGEEPEQEEEGASSQGSSAASFFRDAGSVDSSKSSTQDLDMQSVDSTTASIPSSLPPYRHMSSSVSSSGLSGSGSPKLHRGGDGGSGVGGKVSFDHGAKRSVDNNSSSGISTSPEKDFVSGTTWVFDNSLESGVYSGGDSSQDGGSGAARGRKRNNRRTEEEDDDLGEFLDGFDRETATIKSSAITAGSNSSSGGNQIAAGGSSDNGLESGGVKGHAFASNETRADGTQQQQQYNMMPREGSLVILDGASIVSSLNSLGTDDIVTGLLDVQVSAGREGEGGGEQLLGAAKENIFEFDDRNRRTSDELIAQAGVGGLPPGPLLNTMDNKMVSSLDGNEALERLIGSGLYPKPPSASVLSTTSASVSSTGTSKGMYSRSNTSDRKGSDGEEEEEDLDVFLDGFEEETADMNF